MMKIIAILVILMLAVGATGWCQDIPPGANGKAGGILQISKCPKTQMQRDCLTCHVVGDFRVRETPPDAHRVYPNESMRIMNDDGGLFGYFLLRVVASEPIAGFFDYLREHGITRAVIEINSPGGSLFEAQRIISLMQKWQKRGNSIETQVNGFAASAGFLVFVAGDLGKRFVGPQSDLMWHELISFKMFDISTPSDKEEEGRILRHLQNIRNEWLETRGKLSKAQIDELVRKREFWMSGAQAVGFGFADGYIGGK